MEVRIALEADCKNNCIFCCNHFLVNKKEYKKQKFEDIKNLVLEGIKQEGDFYIGGDEPFNSSLLEKTVDCIKEYSTKKIIIKTSAIIENISKISESLLAKIDIIQLPIHSINEKEVNDIYQNNTAFSQYLEFLKFLKQKNIIEKLRFHILILKQNYNKIETILIFLKEYFGIEEVVLVYPIAPDNSNSETYYQITVEKEIILEKYKNLIKSNKLRLINF